MLAGTGWHRLAQESRTEMAKGLSKARCFCMACLHSTRHHGEQQRTRFDTLFQRAQRPHSRRARVRSPCATLGPASGRCCVHHSDQNIMRTRAPAVATTVATRTGSYHHPGQAGLMVKSQRTATYRRVVIAFAARRFAVNDRHELRHGCGRSQAPLSLSLSPCLSLSTSLNVEVC